MSGATPFAGRRVLIVVENESVPHDRRVWQEARSLTEWGAHVTVVCPRGAGAENTPFEERAEIAIHRFDPSPSAGGIGGYVREYAVALRETRRALRRLGASRPFDAVQACNPPDGMLFAALGARRAGAALIFDQHDLVPELFASRFPRRRSLLRATRLVERATYAAADVVISTNESYRRIAVGRGRRSPADVFVVRNAPDLSRFRPVDPDPSLRRGARFLIGYLGVMGQQDGIDHALLALAELRRLRSDWHAVFVGDGDLLDSMRRMSVSLGLSEQVEFTGWMEQEDVVRVIGSADVCLVPDPPNPLNDVSSLVKVVEYMALGKAIAAYPLAETRNTTGDTALFASTQDPEGLARAVQLLLEDDSLRLGLGRSARARAEAGLSWERSEVELLAAYRRAFAIAEVRRRA